MNYTKINKLLESLEEDLNDVELGIFYYPCQDEHWHVINKLTAPSLKQGLLYLLTKLINRPGPEESEFYSIKNIEYKTNQELSNMTKYELLEYLKATKLCQFIRNNVTGEVYWVAPSVARRNAVERKYNITNVDLGVSPFAEFKNAPAILTPDVNISNEEDWLNMNESDAVDNKHVTTDEEYLDKIKLVISNYIKKKKLEVAFTDEEMKDICNFFLMGIRETEELLGKITIVNEPYPLDKVDINTLAQLAQFYSLPLTLEEKVYNKLSTLFDDINNKDTWTDFDDDYDKVVDDNAENEMHERESMKEVKKLKESIPFEGEEMEDGEMPDEVAVLVKRVYPDDEKAPYFIFNKADLWQLYGGEMSLDDIVWQFIAGELREEIDKVGIGFFYEGKGLDYIWADEISEEDFKRYLRKLKPEIADKYCKNADSLDKKEDPDASLDESLKDKIALKLDLMVLKYIQKKNLSGKLRDLSQSIINKLKDKVKDNPAALNGFAEVLATLIEKRVLRQLDVVDNFDIEEIQNELKQIAKSNHIPFFFDDVIKSNLPDDDEDYDDDEYEDDEYEDYDDEDYYDDDDE